MKATVSIESFIKFAEEYAPFKWETNEHTHQQDIRGKHSVLVSLIRYWHVVRYLQSAFEDEKLGSVLDVGAYPGSFVKIIRRFFGENVAYTGIGLGFSEEYESEMARLGARLFTTELDPEFAEPKAVKDWPFSNVDCCLFLDAIEHLVNPIHCLDNINNSLRLGGKLIITTDNIAAMGNIYSMLKQGESPNIHPVRSKLFYRGDWRPHFREFSLSELFFFLEHSGFRLIKHEYFERKQGDYYLGRHGAICCKNRHKGITGPIKRLLLRYLPHIRDHQILIAEKVAEQKDISLARPKPTHDMAEWLRIRQSYGL